MITPDNGLSIRRSRWIVAVVLTLLLVPVQAADGPLFRVKIVEDGPHLGPGEDSVDPSLESQRIGEGYLLRGYGHEGEYRVLDPNLSSLAVLEPPAGFLVKGCTFSDWGLRLLVWGRALGEANDTMLLFDAGTDAYEEDLLANVTVPLVDIDHARLLAGELILLVAGRDANGTSRAILTETIGNSTRNQMDVPGNRTVVNSAIVRHDVPVLDDEGGVLVFDSDNWTLASTVPPPERRPTIFEVHDDRFVLMAMENGTVVVRHSFGEGFVYEDQVSDGPLEGAMYNKRPNNALYAITARSGEGGGSVLEVWWINEGDWPLVYSMDLDRPVAFIHHVPDEDSLFLVGFEDGSVVRYSIDIRDLPGPTEKPWYLDGKYMVPLLLAVVVILLAWRFLGKGERGRG